MPPEELELPDAAFSVSWSGKKPREPWTQVLRRMHEALSDERSVLELDQALLEFVGGYREDYIRRLPGDGSAGA